MSSTSTAPPRLSRAEGKEKTHRALLGAAERCFLKLGYPGATLDAIAGEAGFTKGAVYWHFRSKEALFLELLAEGLQGNSDDLDRMLTRLEEVPDQLDVELGRWIDLIDARDSLPLLALEMDLESRRNPSFSALLDEINRKHQIKVGKILDRYFEVSGRAPPMHPNELAASIIAITKGIGLARQMQHSSTVTSGKLIRLLIGMPAVELADAH